MSKPLRRSTVTLETTAERIERHHQLGTITEKEHEALHLHEVKGLSYRTISYGLGLSVSTIRDRVRRGEHKMRTHDRKAA
jgi:DNA-directed RNA polymerase specialized sigma24 family protein